MNSPDPSNPAVRAGSFPTTQWTAVMDAALVQGDTGRDAFARLYLDYWSPLYAFVRQRGYGAAEAEDITQDFFTRLIRKQALSGVVREGARFRSFLLASLKNFLANEWDRARAQKRGGGQELLSLDAQEEETRFLSAAPATTVTPESVFEKEWAFTLLEHVAQNTAARYAAEGKAGLYEQLRVYLQGDRGGPPYAETAARLGLSEGAVRVAVHRLRQRYGELLREEVARTTSPEALDEELRYLITVVGQ